jgi:hypothetical protein
MVRSGQWPHRTEQNLFPDEGKERRIEAPGLPSCTISAVVFFSQVTRSHDRSKRQPGGPSGGYKPTPSKASSFASPCLVARGRTCVPRPLLFVPLRPLRWRLIHGFVRLRPCRRGGRGPATATVAAAAAGSEARGARGCSVGGRHDVALLSVAACIRNKSIPSWALGSVWLSFLNPDLYLLWYTITWMVAHPPFAPWCKRTNYRCLLVPGSVAPGGRHDARASGRTRRGQPLPRAPK